MTSAKKYNGSMMEYDKCSLTDSNHLHGIIMRSYLTDNINYTVMLPLTVSGVVMYMFFSTMVVAR